MRIARGLMLPFFVALASSCQSARPPEAPGIPTESAPENGAPNATGNVPSARASYRVVDATEPFWTFWEKAQAATPDEQLRLFKDIVIAAHPELFAANVVSIDPTKKLSDLDDRLRKYLTELPQRIDVMKRLCGSVHGDLAEYDRTFREAFPDMKWSGTVYFTVSIDAFDGAIREVNGKPALLFGIDKIAKIHGDSANLSALFHHELFHTYQFDVNPPKERRDDGPHGMIDPLWTEGLAVYVSKTLNPTASWKQLLLTDEMVHDVTEKLPQIAHEIRGYLDDMTEETHRDFFLGAGRRTDIPKRSAYFVGFLVAERIGKTKSPAQMARLKGDELRRAVDDVLASFEKGAR